MPAELFAEWLEFDAIEPIGFPGLDLQHAADRFVVAACAGNKGLEPADMRLVPVEEVEATPKETAAMIWNALTGAAGPRPDGG